MNEYERRLAVALARYQVISGYLALDPPRGQRTTLREQLAGKVWRDADGHPFQVAAETIRAWVRRYRKKGMAGLEDKPRARRGIQVLTAEQVELCCALKHEVPERSLDRILTIVEEMKLIEPDVVTRSTLHRVLQRAGISRRPPTAASETDLDRFEAAFPNELWQSDMLVGPWLPDAERPGKMRRAYLYAFMDDHSRLVLHGRFSFKGDLPALELVFRRSLQRWGKPRRCYYDNGATYRAKHMAHIVAKIGVHPTVFTQTYRPMGHGKIEALNRLIRSAFIAELKASPMTTLDAINEAFMAWVDSYNRDKHTETNQSPRDRWRAGLDNVAYVDEEALRQAFLWHETRTADKSGCFSLFATRYQVGPELARRKVEVRYDPEALGEVEVWHKGCFVQRISPFEVNRHRRPKPRRVIDAEPLVSSVPPPTADWLSHLVGMRRAEHFIEPSAKQLVDDARARRHAQNQTLVDLLLERLDPAAFDVAAAHTFLERHGPFDLERADVFLARLLAQHPNDQHVDFYLEAIRHALDNNNEDKS